jgi:hypothetical protein
MPSTQSSSNIWLSFIFLLIVAGLTAYYADKKGRSAIIWFVMGLLFSFFAPLVLFFLPSLKDQQDQDSIMPSSSPPSHPELSVRVDSNLSPLAEENKLWYYLDKNHEQYGPVSILALKDLWNTGDLDLNSYVWSQGMETWKKVDELTDLKQALSRYQG